ncbi:IclR family transcriptional regulator [Pseudooceanicola sp. CBS1P-1]|uniref:Helix-turn-helix domain-containing protein n=1 Tax=Pseudooceanicola albus TaxID=2692189 RepID=A0A6L7G031_9RHOB|nr:MULTISPECIES: IclR family transcriptional regulator [Pseudooceanicola]MBT9382338.1 IclR family transcriptional regulator [Pseudooceanicola endophyticus]MXN16880.1 helix-turn-helix domain-containing protein [Pseudooceanicola albus]
MPIKQTDFIASFAKGLQVLECFGAEAVRLSITQVSEATGLDRATARRCLLTLAELGYAEHDGKFFQLTPKVMRLGMGALASLPLTRIVQPWLEELSGRIGESVSVSILDGTEIVYVARAAQRRVMSISLMPGSRLPAYCTSMGRVLLAALPEAEARAVIERSRRVARTPQTLTDPEQIMARLDQVRHSGYAIIDQEIETGLRSIAVPLMNAHGKVVAALNTGLPALHADPEELARDYLPALQSVQAGLRSVLH